MQIFHLIFFYQIAATELVKTPARLVHSDQD